METHKWILYFLGLTILMVEMTVADCPFRCKCEGGLTTCKRLTSLTGVVFPHSSVKVKIVDAKLPVVGPNVFSNQTEHIEFVDCIIGDIQSFTFNDLHKLKKLQFTSSSIKRILPCGISSIMNAENISFSTSTIDGIKAGGFSGLSGLTSLTFPSSIIKSVEPFGFMDVQAEFVSFEDIHIDLIKSAAFSELHDVDTFKLSGTLTRVETGAFYGIKNIQNVQISGNFKELQQKTLMELREATPRGHKTFRFKKSLVTCNCSSASLLDYVQMNPSAVDNTVVCAFSRKPLRNVKPEEVCSDYERDSVSMDATQSLPTCYQYSKATNSSRPTFKFLKNCPEILSDPDADCREGLSNSKTRIVMNVILCALLAFGTNFPMILAQTM